MCPHQALPKGHLENVSAAECTWVNLNITDVPAMGIKMASGVKNPQTAGQQQESEGVGASSVPRFGGHRVVWVGVKVRLS